MAITVSAEAWNHRCVYYEYTGDGVATASSPSSMHAAYARPGRTATAFGITAPTSISHQSGRGGLPFPGGTPIAIASCTVSSAGVITVTTSAAVANGTKACIVVVFDHPGT